jgi:hypothetical protein
MMQEPKNTDGTPAVAGDASDSFISQTKKIGYGSILTDPTFPLARRGIEFYVANPGVVKDRLFGELESTADKVDTAFQSIVNRMGDGAGLGESIRKNFTAAVSQVQLIGLDFKDVQETAEAALDVFKTNVTLSEDQYTNLLSTQEVTGVVAKDLLTGFRDAGMSIKDITKEMYNVTQVANAIGVNAKIVSASVVGNLDKLNRYGFQNGVEGLAKMAAKASALRIDLSETLSIADDLMDPEGAIELSSTLQRLGTTSAALTDPLRLMDMAQNDVGALQEELAKMFSTYAEFSEENQRFEILPSARRELKQLEKELGLPLGTIEKMAIGTKELDKKLSEISFSGFDVPRETQELIANMSMMNEEGEYMIKYVDPETKESMETTTTDFLEKFNGDAKAMQDALGRQQQEENLTLEEINKKMLEKAGDQLTSMQQIEAYTRASTSAFGLGAGGGEYGKQILIANEQLAKDFNTGLIQNLGPNSDISKSFNSLAGDQKKLIEILQSDTATKEEKKKAVGDVMTGYGKVGETVVKSVGTAAGQIATDVGGTLGIDVPGLQDALNLLGVSSDDINKFRTSLDNGATSVTNFVGSLFGKTPTSTPAAAGTTTATGPTSVVIPTQEVNTPTPLQQVNEITSLPIQNTAENLLAPEIQQATKEGMSQALDEELSYYSASPSLAVTIKKDETEGKRIQIPKKSEEIPTEANLVQQTNENVTEINQTETQQTTNLENETNFNVLNEVFNTANKELKDISVINSSLLKTSTEAFDESRSLITNTNSILSSIEQSQTLVKSNNTVASTTTTTTISPTTAAAPTTEATVTKPETPKSEETKIEVKKASKEDVGLFGQSPLMTGPLKIKEEEEIEKRTEFVTKLTDAEIKRYEEKKNQQVTFTDFLNEENKIRQESTKDIQKQKTTSLDNQTQEFIFGQELNEQIIERDNYVTQFTEEEIRLIEEQNNKQLSFNESFEQEIEKRRISTENNLNQQSIIANTNKEEISVGRQLNEQMVERTEFVSMLSEQEISKLDQQNKRQLSFNNLLNEENNIREEYVTKLQETEKDKSVTNVVSGGELTNVSETLSTVNKETVKNKTKTVSETATELHKKLATLYDGVIDESEKGVATAIGQGEKIQESTIFKPEIPKPTTGERTVVTETDFGFGQEIPTSVAEFKGAEDIINQFFTPEAISAVATPIAQTDVERVQELQKSTTSTQNINDNRTLDVTIKTPNITDPTVAENYRKDVINILKGELPNMIERDKGLMDKMRANMTPNFGLTGSQTPGVE